MGSWQIAGDLFLLKSNNLALKSVRIVIVITPLQSEKFLA